MPAPTTAVPEPRGPQWTALAMAAARPDRAGDCATAWMALSELFRDAELGPADWDAVAQALRAAGLSRAEACAILDREVAPAFVPNLLSPAGAWAGWTKAAACELVGAHLARGPIHRRAAVSAARALRPLYAADWDEVAARLPP